MIHVLSAEEIEPEIKGDLRLVDCEDGDEAEITISAPLLARYRRTLAAFIDGAQNVLQPPRHVVPAGPQRSAGRPTRDPLPSHPRADPLTDATAQHAFGVAVGLAGGGAGCDRRALFPEAQAANRSKCRAPTCGPGRSKICASTVSGSGCGKVCCCFLQLLLVALVAIALLRPNWEGERLRERPLHLPRR